MLARVTRWMVAAEPDRYEDETLPPPPFSTYDAVNAYDALTDSTDTDDVSEYEAVMDVADAEEEIAYDELMDVTDTDEVKEYDAVATEPTK